MKGFYLYHDEGRCFDCDAPDRVVHGYYIGVPSRETMARLARKTLPEMTDEEFARQVTVQDWCFVRDDGWNKTLYETETFELQEP